MTVAIKRHVTVQPGGVVEVRAPGELRPGEQAEIIILLEDRAAAANGQPAAEELATARDRLHRFAGAIDSGDPHSSDNDRIDADLARAYGATNDPPT
jgi:hypothetical protein